MTTLESIEQKITQAAAKHEFGEAARLAQIAAQIKELLSAVDTSQGGFPPPEKKLVGQHFPIDRPSQRRGINRGGFVIEITLNGERLRVQEATAASTLVTFMERLLAKLGSGALEKLTTLQVNRGPMISRHPNRDYVNSRTKEPYYNHRIPGTDLFVLTQTDNIQKIRDVKAACRLLGIPSGAVSVFVE